MRFRSVPIVHVVLAVMVSLAVVGARSHRVAFAQIPEAPGTFTDADGEIEHDDPVEGMPARERANQQTGEPAPDAARETIDELQRARERAIGTPEAEPTPSGLNETE